MVSGVKGQAGLVGVVRENHLTNRIGRVHRPLPEADNLLEYQEPHGTGELRDLATWHRGAARPGHMAQGSCKTWPHGTGELRDLATWHRGAARPGHMAQGSCETWPHGTGELQDLAICQLHVCTVH